LREPLLQFLLLGAVLFGLFGVFGNRNETEAPAKIVISVARVTAISDGFTRTWRRPPTEQELRDLIDDYIRDEVFYREGREAGLDRDDVVIRRRIRQKMEFLAEGMAAEEPGEEQLAAYLTSHPERFRTQGRLAFRHVFLSATRRDGTLENDATQLANTLARADSDEGAAAFGDPFLLGEEFHSLSQSDVVHTFGEEFATQIFTVEQGRWQGPIPSGFGLHFVFISERTQGSVPPLDAIRPAVRKEWSNQRRLEAEQALYRKLRNRYEIIVEVPPVKVAGSQAAQ